MKDTSQAKSNRYFRTDHLKADLKGRSVRGGAVTLTAQACKLTLTLSSNIILARLLNPADYGLVGMVTAVIGLISLFKDMGLSMATVQKAEINHQQVSTLFWVNLLVSMSITILALILAPVIAWFYNEPRLTLITFALTIGFILGGLTIQHQALLNRQMRFTSLAVIDVTANAMGIIAAIIAATNGLGYWSLIIMQLVIPFVNMIGVWLMCEWRPGKPSLNSGIRSMLVFGGNVTGFSFINYIARNIDNVLIGKYWGAQQLGFYAKAYQLLLLPLNQINAPVGAVAIPTLSRLVDSPENYKQAYLKILRTLSILTLPLVAFMIATSDWLVELLLGSQWSQASSIFSLLGIVALAQPVTNTVGWLFISQGRTHHMLQSGAICGLLSILSIIAGLPWGATGVAAFYSISGLVIRTPILLWFAGKEGTVKLKDIGYTLVPQFAISLVGMMAVFIFRQSYDSFNPMLGLLITFFINASVNLLILSILPSGRLILSDFKDLLVHLFRKGR